MTQVAPRLPAGTVSALRDCRVCYKTTELFAMHKEVEPRWVVAVMVMAAALLVVLPFAWRGDPSGHDFEFHLSSWMEVANQWKQGIAFPRWAALAHFGYGEARFIFYPPLSWMLGAALGTVMPWAITPATYVWLVLSIGGWCMYRLACEWLPARDAIAAAVLYVVNPYHVVVVYWRSAYAELLADAFFPLLLLSVLRPSEQPRRVVLPLSLTLAAIWLSNAPAAVIATYSLVLLAITISTLERDWRVVAAAFVAVVLALGLAAFYIIPAAWEQKWVNIGEILSPGVRPADNFLFTTIADPEHNIFNLLVSAVAAAESVAVALGIFALRRWRRERRERWWALVIWATVTSALMFPITNILWEHLPKLKFVQLPWRWLVPLNVMFAIVLAAAIRKNIARVVVVALIAVGMFGLSDRVLSPWWDTAQDIALIHQSFVTSAGYEGTDEYVPRGADPYEIKPEAPKVEVLAADGEQTATAAVSNVKWRPELKKFTVQAIESAKLVLHLFNYPAWHAEVAGREVPSDTTDVTGQMVIAVPAGQSRVRIRFTRTYDRDVGIAVSLLAGLVVVILGVISYRTSKSQA